MKKFFLLLIALVLLSQLSFAQKETLTGDAAKDLMRKINLDTTKFLSGAGNNACKCIDSLSVNKKDARQISADIAACIDKEVSSYQLALKLYHTMVDAGNNKKIELNINKNSADYKQYYYEIERWLNDSCAVLRRIAASDNKESENSLSSDKIAIGYYNKGIKFFEKDDYKAALPWFEKAVAEDEKFAFAWDNIGICRRKLGDLDGAMVAYNKSLELDSTGKTPLQNIAVVYEFKKDYDKALNAYQRLAKAYPEDPEAYYGTGRMFELKNDFEKALDNMCKAYNAYIAINSPYRSDAEKNIGYYYQKMKEQGKEEKFFAILKENNIKTK